jgi:thioredoxin-like negative regulator of GroEL
MKIIFITIFTALTSLVPLVAAAELKSAKALHLHWQKDAKSATLLAEVDKGYHFNAEAPNGFTFAGQFKGFKPTDAHHLTLTSLPLAGEITARIYVCDDAVTFCETHNLKYKVEEQKVGLIAPLIESYGAERILASAETVKNSQRASESKKENGFWQDDLNSGLGEALAQSKIVLVDFGARWCPSCLRLEADVFKNREFQKSTSGVVKVKIDVDRFENMVLLEKFKIQGYPTVLVLNSAGDEIVRFTDYQTLDFVLKTLNEAQKYPVSVAALRAQAEKTNLNRDWQLLWTRYFQTEDYASALALENHLSAKPDLYLDARFEAALKKLKSEKASAEIINQTLSPILAEEPNSTRSMRWRSEWIEALSETSAQGKDIERLAKETLDLALSLLKNQEALKLALQRDNLGEFRGFEKFYVAFTAAETMESAHLTPDTRASAVWALAYDIGKQSHITPAQKGTSLRWLTTALLSKQYEEANALAKQLLRQDPNNGDLQRRQTKILVELRHFDEASALGEKALKNSYGLNELTVVEPLARAYWGSHQREKAKALVQKYLSVPELQTDKLKNMEKKLMALKETFY